MLYQTTFLFLMCFCMLLLLVEFSHGFVVLRSSPLQSSKGSCKNKNKVPAQLRAQPGPAEYYELANKVTDGAGFFATGAGLFGFAAIALLSYSITQNSVGMSEMRERMDKAAADTNMKFNVTSLLSLLSLLVAVIALLKPEIPK